MDVNELLKLTELSKEIVFANEPVEPDPKLCVFASESADHL